ncbi:hypothetical protein B0H66DRAFT_476034 [Apodospora peruviana]|uniref:BHLH domain-containing protein n=1 Tax=Apodospora peruviana TaxID=516989 RepID=A0AAE0I5G3_9PEZI|nr:hypothetical protein B0H66DRAFT_476034 [Apodospora peruviana]
MTSGYGYLNLANGGYNFSPYLSVDGLDSPNMDDTTYDYFSLPVTSLGSGGMVYSLHGSNRTNWPTPNSLSETPLTSPLPAMDSFPGGDFVPPDMWAGETDSESCDHDLFTSTTDAFPSPNSDFPPALKGTGSAGTSHQPADALYSPSSSGRGGSHKIQLRTASRKAKAASCNAARDSLSPTATSPGGRSHVKVEDDEALTSEERRARQSHNLVEKQYRNRLNAQFERLLAALPADQRDGTGIDSDSMLDAAASADKRLSKAEVLELATKRIRTLEKERERLQQEHGELMQNVDILTNAVARQGSAAR